MPPKKLPPRTASQLRLSENIWAKLRVIADKELRTVNSQIEYYLMKSVEQYERENGAILVPLDEDES